MNALASTAPQSGSLAHSIRVGLALVWIDLKQGMRKHLAGNTWRDRMLQSGGALFGLTFFAVLHLAAYSLILYAGTGYLNSQNHADTHGMRDLFRGLGTAVWCFLLFVMISGGLMRALVVLHEQDDSSLLLSSPVSPRAILAARLFGNALQSCLVDGFIIVPWLDVLVCSGHFANLWGYPVWFALAVIVTCVDGLLSFGLIAWLGLRRARLFSQIVPFVLIFGVTFFAGSLSISVAQMSGDGVTQRMPPAMQAHFIALAHSPLVWINRASGGNVIGLAMVFSTAAALALITLRLTERAFIEGSQNLAENSADARPGDADAPFRSGLLFLEIRKNLRLIARTPMMIVQCLAQVLTPIGIAFVLGREDLARAAAFFMIFVSGVLSGMFTIAAGTVEECDDLLQMAPRNRFLFRLGKMLTGGLPTLGLLLLVGIGLFIANQSLQAIAVLFAGIPLTLASCIIGETFATPVKPGQRPKLLADPIMLIPLLGMQITSGIIAGLAVFTASIYLPFLILSLLLSYMLLVIAIGLAQLRKPLF